MKEISLNTQNEIVNKISKLNFSGNIIPESWYSHLRNDKGKPYLKAAVILSEIIYWYRACEKRNDITSKTRYEVKFASDKLQLTYAQIEDKFGFTKEESRPAIEYLIKQGLINRELRTIETKAGIRNNVMFVEPIPERIEEITFTPSDKKPMTLVGKNQLPSSENSNDLSGKIPTTLVGKNQLPSLENSHNNTEISSKTSSEISSKTSIIIEENLFENEKQKIKFRERHKEHLARLKQTELKQTFYQVDELGRELDWSLEKYEQLIYWKSKHDFWRNTTDTAHYLLKALKNVALNDIPEKVKTLDDELMERIA